MATGGEDPLSFFAGDVSSSSESEGEDEDRSEVVPLNDKSYYTSSKEQVGPIIVNMAFLAAGLH